MKKKKIRKVCCFAFRTECQVLSRCLEDESSTSEDKSDTGLDVGGSTSVHDHARGGGGVGGHGGAAGARGHGSRAVLAIADGNGLGGCAVAVVHVGSGLSAAGADGGGQDSGLKSELACESGIEPWE